MTVLGAAAGFAAQSIGNLDAVGGVANWVSNAKVNNAAQAFDRRMARINYKIQRQQLHREDIRDLVELTVGRMDIYHVVGTLLLTFCIQWYTDNTMLVQKPPLPQWFVTLFFVSNFSAVGYLIFSVWLAMHASVASHSIGVRLLTSFARLSIPSARDISNIRVPITPFLDDLTTRLNDFMQKKRIKGSGKGTEDAAPASSAGKNASAASAEGPAPPPDEACAPPDMEGVDQEEEEEDDREHFHRFLEEQKRWLCYDAFSRICMSFGMNQMLQSLSYYILGVVWADSAATAVTSFVAVKLLAGLLLKLDVSETEGSRIRERMALIFLYMMPPAIACSLLWVPRVEKQLREDSLMLSAAAFPVFAMHGGWMIFLASQVHTKAGQSKDSIAAYLPRKLRTVYYLNVLDPDQRKEAEKVKSDLAEALAQKSASQVRAAREELQSKIEEVMKNEKEQEALSARSRNSPDLLQISVRLEELVVKSRDALASREARGSFLQGTQRNLSDELHSAEQDLNHFAVWSKAPEIKAQLDALKNEEVQAILAEGEKQEIEDVYQDFLRKCQELRLGGALPTTENERVAVRVEAYSGCLPQSIWIDTKYDEVGVEAPRTFMAAQEDGEQLRNLRATSAHHFLHQQVPMYRELQLPLLEQSAAEAPPAEAAQASVDVVLQEEWPPPSTKLIDPMATPDDKLPGHLVRKLTLGTAWLWLLAGAAHVFRHTCRDFSCFWDGFTNDSQRHSEELRQIRAIWPEPAGFFDVVSMHCNSSQVLVGGEFATFAAERRPGNRSALGAFAELGQGALGAGSTVMCGHQECDGLVKSDDGSWLLQSLEAACAQPADSRANATSIPIPVTWRMVAGMRIQASCSTCAAGSAVPWARLAGWDGSSIVVADLLQRKGAAGIPLYTLRQRFRVSPGRGSVGNTEFSCASQKSGGSCSNGKAGSRERYESVNALQFRGSEAQQLMVLSEGGVLDVWDLPLSTRLGRWRIGEAADAFTTMCLDGQELLLSSSTARGPLLRAWRLPAALLKPEEA